MPCTSQIELTDLRLDTKIGTYGPTDVVPDAHVLDMTLEIDPALVLIDVDGMSHVFDYDPLVVEIDRLAREMHYDTQERLMTRIVKACARHKEIGAVSLSLRKYPVWNESGVLGVRLHVDAETLDGMRAAGP